MKYNISIRTVSALNDNETKTGFKTLAEHKQFFSRKLSNGRINKTGYLKVKELKDIKTINALISNLTNADINSAKNHQTFYSVIAVKKV